METEHYSSTRPIRLVTATSLFDGHDAAINIMRRILQDAGAEVIHIGHNRSVKEVVDAAIEEDVHGIAVSSYQGGHMEYFRYMVDLLKQEGAGHIKIFGGGGGVIIPEEAQQLHDYGVARIFTPEDGAEMGLIGMINHMLRLMDQEQEHAARDILPDPALLSMEKTAPLARMISAAQSAIEKGEHLPEKIQNKLQQLALKNPAPIIGLTGTGGAGKSSLTDELISRLLLDFKDLHIGVICCDPSRRKTGGALLGDRIRMNSINSDRVYMRSLATRNSRTELSAVLPETIRIVKAAGYDLILLETAGIGQGDSSIVDLSDLSVYVMTAEYGAPSQLEKIDMLDYADIVVLNKFEKKGSKDALRDIRKQVQRNRNAFETDPARMPVYPTIASRFNDTGTTKMYLALLDQIQKKTDRELVSSLPVPESQPLEETGHIIPGNRIRYLSEIAETIREYHTRTGDQAQKVRQRYHLEKAGELMCAPDADALENSKGKLEIREKEISQIAKALNLKIKNFEKEISETTRAVLLQYDQLRAAYQQEQLSCTVRGKAAHLDLYQNSLSHLKIPKISVPGFSDPGDIYTWMRKENFPGYFPYTAGVFPLKRQDEEPTRMFAGEGGPEDTNRRFKLLSSDYKAKRLSTAFDSVTLYGFDPDPRPDIYGKVGTSGVSICTLDDLKDLYDGFDLCDPATSVSMTINGPAPMILAMFLSTAIDQAVSAFEHQNKKAPSPKQLEQIRQEALSNVRGTVQADILKEDQGQNTCLFSIDFALKMMGDIQEYFIRNNIKKFYSVSISGYHIAEAGANPLTQLALTLANGFTYVEYYLSRGMDIDAFAPSFSFFFSNGMDPEYTVIGRVARRIWAIAMKKRYGAGEAAQKLKYHIQTSGRSLHSQEMQFNDIRTTLQALCAIYDNCNSLHTNAYDEAVTTPGKESVRRALAIQMIINREWGLTLNENPLQGSFIVDELTDLVEEAVLLEFDRITERGGVLGAMERGFQRSRIQEESAYYEFLKHSGEIPLIGVNTFLDPDTPDAPLVIPELSRATQAQKDRQLKRLKAFHRSHQADRESALAKLKDTVLKGENIFEELMQTVRVCSLGQITQALYEVGGKYRRNM